MMNDPVADMLTRIRNAVNIERPYVDMPLSKLKLAVANALEREGFIWDHEVIEQEPQSVLRLNLKYGPNGEKVIQKISRVSRPGRRVYTSVREMKDVLNGMGINILSTPKGVLSNREARKEGVGGEILCTIW